MSRSPISCIVPAHNGERYLAEAIDCLLGQTFPAMEVIIVDDGSTDNTAEVAKRYGERIVYLHQPNAGVSSARNLGIRVSRGEFLCFLDADDLVHVEKLQRQINRLAARPEIDLCACHARYFWSDELSQQDREADPRYPHPFWTKSTGGHISTWLVRRDLIDSVGLFDENLAYAEDADWYLRVRDTGAIIETLPDVLAYRRLHANNSTREDRDLQINGLTSVLKSALDRRRDRQ